MAKVRHLLFLRLVLNISEITSVLFFSAKKEQFSLNYLNKLSFLFFHDFITFLITSISVLHYRCNSLSLIFNNYFTITLWHIQILHTFINYFEGNTIKRHF